MDRDQLEHLQALHNAHLQRLRVLELKIAQQGYNTLPEVITEAKELRGQIHDIKRDIDKIKGTPSYVYDFPRSDDNNRSCLEIVIKGDLGNWSTEIQNAAIRAFAGIMEIPAEQVRLLMVSSGSVRLLLLVPTVSAQRLLKLHETRDATLQYIGVKKVRIVAIEVRKFSNMLELKSYVSNVRSEITSIESKTITATVIIAMIIAQVYPQIYNSISIFNFIYNLIVGIAWWTIVFTIGWFIYLKKLSQMKQDKLTQIELYYEETIYGILESKATKDQFTEAQMK